MPTVLVCHCFAVFEGAVREAVADGAATVDDLGEATGAGQGCGGCHASLCRMLPEHGTGGCRGQECAGSGVADLVAAVG